jgi:hypothetical protein
VFDLVASCIDDPVLVRVALAQLDFDGGYDPRRCWRSAAEASPAASGFAPRSPSSTRASP